MTYTIVVRGESVYAGLVFPKVRPSFKVSNSELIEFLKDRVRERLDAAGSPDGQRPMYTVYVRTPTGTYNALVCFEYTDPGLAPVGDVLVRVPRGVYARFVPNGDYHDPVEDVWAQVDD